MQIVINILAGNYTKVLKKQLRLIGEKLKHGEWLLINYIALYKYIRYYCELYSLQYNVQLCLMIGDPLLP